jgi:hypothetical protein
MNKKYIVRLTAQERDELTAVIKKLKGTSERVRRAQILLKADADGPNWTDRRIGEAFGLSSYSSPSLPLLFSQNQHATAHVRDRIPTLARPARH